jgi:hypothetical protein
LGLNVYRCHQECFGKKIIERSIKESKTLSSSKQGHHTTAGSGASKAAVESTSETENVMMVEVTWMQPYLAYMINKTLLEDVVESQRIVRWSKAFVVVQGKLYKKNITRVLQRYVTPQEGQVILKDIHVGVCGHHASSRAIAAKAFRAGFYWLTSSKDVRLACDFLLSVYWIPGIPVHLLLGHFNSPALA